MKRDTKVSLGGESRNDCLGKTTDDEEFARQSSSQFVNCTERVREPDTVLTKAPINYSIFHKEVQSCEGSIVQV